MAAKTAKTLSAAVLAIAGITIVVLAGLFVHGQEGQPPPGVPTVSVAELLAQGKQLEGRKRGRESFLDGRVPRGVSFPRCRDDRGKRWAAWRTTC